ICDQCDTYWHAQCAGLTKIPKDKYWYCPDCINTDVDLIVDKKKKIQNTKSLDALMRMREKECAIVPRNHVGKIPGVYCGQTWENLNACSDWGIHRTTSFSSRVLGGSDTGAVSIFLYRNSRNFKTYEDKGYEFIFSGLGVISKVTSSLMDKSLVRQDLSLALTCDAPLNSKTGSKAVNWKRSRPIRVCRAHVEKFMSEFDPVEGVRYDGIYKVVEYWPVTCQNPKRVVWKFKLRRDDDELAPWLVQSKNLSIERGLRMIYEDEDKAKKIVQYKIPPHIIQMMDEDTANKRKWDEVKKLEFWSEFEFINYLFDTVIVCNSGACSKPIQNPIVTSCGHICCKKCLTYSKSDTCFTCRSPINKGRMVSNVALIGILKVFSPTYGQNTEKIPCPAMRYDPPKRKRDGSIDLKKRKKIRIVIDSV
ncbi:ubiquitin-like with PHD and RING finger domains 2, partial [Rhizopus stolonifer]